MGLTLSEKIQEKRRPENPDAAVRLSKNYEKQLCDRAAGEE